mmetsp:Transcript_9077/g.12933  ORF Transcript_9077/g.12933 Transcript_9077/m.12933 type:complete len:137 (-) Transcript_9077:475-885(-)
MVCHKCYCFEFYFIFIRFHCFFFYTLLLPFNGLDVSSSPIKFLNMRVAVRRPNGMYDKEYQILAQNCAINNNTKTNNFTTDNFVPNGIKHTTSVAPKQERYTVDVILRFSSNMFLSCRLGPHKNMDDKSAKILPIV